MTTVQTKLLLIVAAFLPLLYASCASSHRDGDADSLSWNSLPFLSSHVDQSWTFFDLPSEYVALTVMIKDRSESDAVAEFHLRAAIDPEVGTMPEAAKVTESMEQVNRDPIEYRLCGFESDANTQDEWKPISFGVTRTGPYASGFASHGLALRSDRHVYMQLRKPGTGWTKTLYILGTFPNVP